MKKKILIVEDERAIWEDLRNVLGTDVYEFEWVQTGHEAARRSLDISFDVIVLDTDLSDVAPRKVLNCLCRLHPFTAIVALVQNTDEIEMATIAGASVCVLKPVGGRAFFKAIQRVLAEPSQERVRRRMESHRFHMPDPDVTLCE